VARRSLREKLYARGALPTKVRGRSTRALGVILKSPHLEFSSTAFPAVPGEDEATNPGITGKALAEWLSMQLRTDGYDPTGVIAEDFGWCVPIKTGGYKVFVACASASSDASTWRVFAFADGGVLTRLVGKDTRSDAVAEVYSRIKEILVRSPDVHDLTVKRT